ncbi:WD40-repeat protein, partial [Thalassiosira pseudonana CCMP1335]
ISTTITSNNLQSHLDALSLDDAETCVAKVTPERIYSVTCHPSPHHIIACAGDKKGHVGIWNVDQYNPNSTNDGVHLFKPHSGAVSSMIWNASGTTLLSASYDGSVRAFDASKQVFEEIFATYDDDEQYKNKIGDGKCFFLSTSEGSVMHVNLRSNGKLTFDQTLSEKKINSVSLHPDGNVMATAGLSTIVQLWDVRQMGASDKKAPKPLAWQHSGKSINSAFFSPTGKRIVATTMSNTLDIFEDAHLASGLIKAPKKRIKHDNMTGRWLSTFMARW